MLCANAGDSRAIASVGGKAVELSRDHKPDDQVEKDRIEKAGGFVSNGRVEGNLAVSRALGDFEYKSKDNVHVSEQPVTAKCDFIKVPVTPDLEFIFLACDGVWDVRTNQEAVELLHKHCYQNNYTQTKKDIKSFKGGLEKFVDECCPDEIPPGGKGTDNISALIVHFVSN